MPADAMGRGYSGKASSRIRLTAAYKEQEKKLGADLTLKDKAFSKLDCSPTRQSSIAGLTKQIPHTNQCLAAARIDGAREGPGFPHRRRTVP